MVDVNTTEIDKPASADLAPICTQFPSRLAITGVILDCIRQLFSNSANLLHPQLKDFFWASEPTLDPLRAPFQVIVEEIFAFDLAKSGIRPAILIKPGDWTEQRLVLGDNSLGQEIYHKKILGNHVIQIVAKTSPQAELLAREVQGYLSHFGPLLREWMELVRWEVPGIKAPTELEEQSENVTILIPITYELVYSWEIQPNTSRLMRQIVVNAIMHTEQDNSTSTQLGVQ